MIVSKLARTTLSFNKSNVSKALSSFYIGYQFKAIFLSKFKLKVYGIIYRNLASDSKPGIFRRSLRSKDASGSGSFQSGAPSYTRKNF